MKKEEYQKLEKKYRNLLEEVIEVYNKIGNIPYKYEFVIDDCNSVVLKCVFTPFFDIDDIDIYIDDVELQVSPLFKNLICGDYLIQSDEFRENHSEYVKAVFADEIKQANEIYDKLELELLNESDVGWLIDMLYSQDCDIDDLLKGILEDIEYKEPTLYSTCKKIWKEVSFDEFATNEKLKMGDVFFSMNGDKIEKHKIKLSF